jgi:hypothetical protein
MAITQFIRDRERQQMVYCLASERRPFHDLSRGIVIIKKRLVIANVLNDRQLSLSNFRWNLNNYDENYPHGNRVNVPKR